VSRSRRIDLVRQALESPLEEPGIRRRRDARVLGSFSRQFSRRSISGLRVSGNDVLEAVDAQADVAPRFPRAAEVAV